MTILTKNQKITKSKVVGNEKIVVTIRHDDQCGNGHNSFSITGELFEKGTRGGWGWSCGGCIHDEVARFFPDLKPYLKWHLCSTDGPMHYLANTLYHASNRDYNRLLKGEKRQIINGRTKLPCWHLVAVDQEGNETSLRLLDNTADSETCPELQYKLAWVPWCRTGEGKEPDLEAARSSAIWPDATLEQLQDKALLEARLPDLIKEFQEAVESLGLIY